MFLLQCFGVRYGVERLLRDAAESGELLRCATEWNTFAQSRNGTPRGKRIHLALACGRAVAGEALYR